MTLESLRRPFTTPYPVTWPMVALMLLVPTYVLVGAHVRQGPLHAPALPIDAAIPLEPAWVLIYGALYLFLILLPVFVIRSEPQVRRLFLTYLAIWIVSYAVFLAFPTRAPRVGDFSPAINSFADWGIAALYQMDQPLNCFPSLHVAHSFVSAFAVGRVHRTLGAFAAVGALLVGVSTLFTRQHWALDVVAGAALAYAAYALLQKRFGEHPIEDQRAAPAAAVSTAIAVAVAFVCYYALYRAGVRF